MIALKDVHCREVYCNCVMGVSRILIKGRQMGKVVICMHINYALCKCAIIENNGLQTLKIL